MFAKPNINCRKSSPCFDEWLSLVRFLLVELKGALSYPVALGSRFCDDLLGLAMRKTFYCFANKFECDFVYVVCIEIIRLACLVMFVYEM